VTAHKHLYIIGEGDGCAVVKIGKSLDPLKRLAELQTGYPRKLRLLYVEPEAGHLERWLHDCFAEYRQEGEWFDFGDKDPVAEVRERISAWRKENEHSHVGEPSYYAHIHLRCRHPDCRAAAVEYRARLKSRKKSGEFEDHRFKAHRQPADEVPQQLDAEQLFAKIKADPALAEQFWNLISPDQPEPTAEEPNASAAPPEPVAEQLALPAPSDTPEPEPAPSDDSGASDGGLSPTAESVLKYLGICADTEGKLRPMMVGMLPNILRITSDHCQAAFDELEQAGMLAGDGADLFLVNADAAA
jgi:hypothetical protein